MKLESFIFDVFPLSSNMTILQVKREDEFAPVKNSPGSATDSPCQAREIGERIYIFIMSKYYLNKMKLLYRHLL